MTPTDNFIPSTPWSRLLELIGDDRRDLTVLLVYTLLNGLLMLTVPLATQALVNTIAAGIFLQPLVVLSLLVFLGLVFAGILRLMQFTLVEVLQQRIFAKVALRLAYRLPRVQLDAVRDKYTPKLVNRFFDVLTIQKTWSKILLDGPSAVLQILVGLVLLAFYSPILLAFDILLIGGIVIVIWGLSFGGLQKSIEESYRKYEVAGWLEELARCHLSHKMAGLPKAIIEQTDALVRDYIDARGQHFEVLYRHSAGTYLLYAIASAGVLALGGWLVINRQLTLGQLVAAEIVVVSILAALEKLMRLIEPFYDLLTGMDKVGHVMDFPLERENGTELPQRPQGASLLCRGIQFAYPNSVPILSHINLVIPAGSRLALVGTSGTGKTTFARLLAGLQEPTKGTLEINGLDIRDLELNSLRKVVSLSSDSHEIFEGTIEDNITLGRQWLSTQDIRWALEVSQFAEDVAQMPQGKKNRLVSEGRNLSLGQRQKLMIARAIVGRPQLLILDETLSALDHDTQNLIMDAILDPAQPWTTLLITHLPQVVTRCDRVLVLHQGQIVEDNAPQALLQPSGSLFSKIFPTLKECV